MKKQETVERVVELLQRCQYANLATMSDAGPWNTPVTVMADADLTLYWSSWKQAQHSLNLYRDPRVAITLYDSTRDRGTNNRQCLYLTGKVREVSEEAEGEKAHHMIYPDQPIELADFFGEGVRRFYATTVTGAWLNVLSERQVTADTSAMRESVTLSAIRAALSD